MESLRPNGITLVGTGAETNSDIKSGGNWSGEAGTGRRTGAWLHPGLGNNFNGQTYMAWAPPGESIQVCKLATGTVYLAGNICMCPDSLPYL